MTEQDLKDKEKEQEVATELEKTVSNSAEENDTEVATEEMTEKTEEKSEFFKRWEARHQAYLSGKSQESEQEEQDEQEQEVVEEKEFSPSFHYLEETTHYLEETTEEEQLEQPIEKREKSILGSIILKSLPIFLTSLVLIIASLYFISPYSKQKRITVTGNTRLSTDQILSYSQIAIRDYTLTTALHKDDYAKNIKNSSTWIKSAKITYQFPQSFTIQVEEYTEIAFVKKDDNYYSVLSSGDISATPVQSEQLPAQYTTINLENSSQIKELVLQLAKIQSNVAKNIESISLTPSKATTDLLTLTMYDGNKVLIPLTEVEQKLPYYEKVTSQLTVASVIDMEVGIFTYSQ